MEQSTERPTFRSYCKRLKSRLYEEAAPWARDNIFWGIIMLIAPPTAIYLRNHNATLDWETVRIATYLYGGAFVIYLAFHCVRTVWKLDTDRANEVAAEKAVSEIMEQKIKASATKQQVSEWIGQKLLDAKELSGMNPKTDTEVFEFQLEFEQWVENVESGLRARGLTADAYLFSTADSGFVRLPQVSIIKKTTEQVGFQFVQDVRQSCSARLYRYEYALKEILKKYSG